MSAKKSGVDISVIDGIQIIKFNNQKKKNAISVEAYRVIKKSLEDAAKNEEIFFTVITGEGAFYSSGFDITDPENMNNPDTKKHLRDLIDAFIDYPKLLLAVVNGPAIGLAVTTLGLCDIVYASDRASFTTPFSSLGLCAEGCATYTFPKILGKSKASEMLYVGHKMSAKEALQFNFVAEVIPHSELNKIWEKIRKFKELSRHSIAVSKKMTKDFDRGKLHEANHKEIEALQDCIAGDDFGKSIMTFLSRKSKL